MSDDVNNVLQFVVGQMLDERRAARDAWIAKARAEFAPSLRAPCFVCGKFRPITHAHHLTPLAMQYSRKAEAADHAHVWLCPNHHAILHAFIDGNEAAREPATAMTLMEGCTKQEVDTLWQLFKSAFGAVELPE